MHLHCLTASLLIFTTVTVNSINFGPNFGHLCDCVQISTNTTLSCGAANMPISPCNFDNEIVGSTRPEKCANMDDIFFYMCFTDSGISFVMECSSDDVDYGDDVTQLGSYFYVICSDCETWTSNSDDIGSYNCVDAGSDDEFKYNAITDGKMKLVQEDKWQKWKTASLMMVICLFFSVLTNSYFCFKSLRDHRKATISTIPVDGDDSVQFTHIAEQGAAKMNGKDANASNCGYISLINREQNQDAGYALLKKKSHLTEKGACQLVHPKKPPPIAPRRDRPKQLSTPRVDSLGTQPGTSAKPASGRMSILESSGNYEDVENDPDQRPPTYLDIDDSEHDDSYDYTDEEKCEAAMDRLATLKNTEYANSNVGRSATNTSRQRQWSPNEITTAPFRMPRANYKYRNSSSL